MAVPKHRGTKSQQNQRRMHLFLEETTLAVCPKCGSRLRPHTVCPNCGHYKGKQVIDVLAKLEKKERKKRQKEIAEKEKEDKREQKPLTMEELSKKKF